MQIARERRDAQEAWAAMEVKVPEHAPWAPNGYARLLEKMETASQVLAMKRKDLTQARVNAAASSLNVAINTMRPGNLAEPEDLHELMPLMLDSRWRIENKTTQLREAIDYAEMVMQYVNDGSGTRDLIDKAVSLLRQARRDMGEE